MLLRSTENPLAGRRFVASRLDRGFSTCIRCVRTCVSLEVKTNLRELDARFVGRGVDTKTPLAGHRSIPSRRNGDAYKYSRRAATDSRVDALLRSTETLIAGRRYVASRLGRALGTCIRCVRTRLNLEYLRLTFVIKVQALIPLTSIPGRKKLESRPPRAVDQYDRELGRTMTQKRGLRAPGPQLADVEIRGRSCGRRCEGWPGRRGIGHAVSNSLVQFTGRRYVVSTR